MMRFIKCLLLMTFMAPLTACGIKGNLKTPPPVWSNNVDQTDQTDEAEAMANEAVVEDEEEDVGYGIDVADNP